MCFEDSAGWGWIVPMNSTQYQAFVHAWRPRRAVLRLNITGEQGAPLARGIILASWALACR